MDLSKNKYSIQNFVNTTVQEEDNNQKFSRQNERILKVKMDAPLWIKLNSMISYTGEMKFTREGMFEHGADRALKKFFTGEGARLTKVEGNGDLYLADQGKKIIILHLEGDSLIVNGNDLLAFESSVNWDIKFMRKLTAIISAGFFNVKLEGNGYAAIATHHTPLTFKVTPDKPLYTDPLATVAWSGSLEPDLKTDFSVKTFLGRGSGETIQMKFQGEGFVVVQPFLEHFSSYSF